MVSTRSLRGYVSDHKEILIHLAPIFLLGLTPLLWFKNDYLILGGDSIFPLNPTTSFLRSLYVWQDYLDAGFFKYPCLLPYYAVLAFLSDIGLPLAAIERLWFVFIFSLTGFSMYYLSSTLMDGEGRHTASLVSAIFYMFNIPLLIDWSGLVDVLILAYATTPLMLGLCARGINKREGWIKYAVLAGLASLISAPSAVNAARLGVTGFILISFFVFHVILRIGDREKMAHIVRFGVTTALILFLFNVWWLLPMLYGTFTSPPSGEWIIRIGFVYRYSRDSFLVEALRLLGFWGWYSSFEGTPYYPYAKSYLSDPLLVGVSFMIPLLAFGCSLVGRNKYGAYFTFLSLSGIFLTKGINPPLGGLYEWLYFHLPSFWIFRNPYHFSRMIALGYAFVLGIFTSDIHHRLRGSGSSGKIGGKGPHLANVFTLFVVAFILLWSYPLLAPDFIREKRGSLASLHHKIPSYYYEASDWLEAEAEGGDFRIFLLPQSGIYVWYKWGYSGRDITQDLIERPQISGFATSLPVAYGGALPHFLQLSYDDLLGRANPYVGKQLGLMNVRYVLLRADIYKATSTERLASALRFQEGIHLVKRIGDLMFYRNEHCAPHIHATRSLILVDGGLEEAGEVVYSEDFDVESALFLSEQLSPDERELVLTSKKLFESGQVGPIGTRYEKIDPTRYVVHLSGNGPSFLVFNEAYDPGWKAYVNGREETRHLIVNGYANGWLIEEGGECDVTLEYWPQKLFEMGAVSTLLSLIACISYCLKSRVTALWKGAERQRGGSRLSESRSPR